MIRFRFVVVIAAVVGSPVDADRPTEGSVRQKDLVENLNFCRQSVR